MSLKRGVPVEIVRAKPLRGHRLELAFSDGHVSTVEFGPFLRKSLHPDTRQFVDLKRFRQFSVTDGNLVWGDYEMCFPLADLYEGTILPEPASVEVSAVAEARSEYGVKPRSRARKS